MNSVTGSSSSRDMNESNAVSSSGTGVGGGDDKKQHDARTRPSFVTQLQPNDVLTGRGGPIVSNPGNVRFIDIIRSRCPEYQATSSRKQKHIIAQQIASTVRKRNGLFLRKIVCKEESEKLGVPDGNTNIVAWTCADESTVLLKIKQALRDQGLSSSSSSQSPTVRIDQSNAKKAGSTNKPPPKKRHKRAAQAAAEVAIDRGLGIGSGAPSDVAVDRHGTVTSRMIPNPLKVDREGTNTSSTTGAVGEGGDIQ